MITCSTYFPWPLPIIHGHPPFPPPLRQVRDLQRRVDALRHAFEKAQWRPNFLSADAGFGSGLPFASLGIWDYILVQSEFWFGDTFFGFICFFFAWRVCCLVLLHSATDSLARGTEWRWTQHCASWTWSKRGWRGRGFSTGDSISGECICIPSKKHNNNDVTLVIFKEKVDDILRHDNVDKNGNLKGKNRWNFKGWWFEKAITKWCINKR